MPIDKNISPEQARFGNRAFWDEITPRHLISYDLEGFLEGKPWLPKNILEEVGDVNGKSLLHLQCHFGLDSLAWASLGAEVTGVDFSPRSIKSARDLAERTKLQAQFLCSDIYDLPQNLTGKFDIVFTSVGVLCWLNDLNAWARVIAHFLKPGGFFYIMEGHPLLYTFDDDGDWTFTLSYFHKEQPYFWGEDTTDYMDTSYHPEAPTYEWQWSISDIINALLRAGLKLEFFNEFSALENQIYPEMIQGQDGLYTFPNMPVELPVLFSLKAIKE
jgi:SAM-dependent methyltransferase